MYIYTVYNFNYDHVIIIQSIIILNIRLDVQTARQVLTDLADAEENRIDQTE